MCANAASAISLGAPESLHQSRKDDRIPGGMASIPFSRTSLEIVELDSGFPVGDGKTSPVAPVRWAALSMMFRAGLFRGTRCGRPVLVRSPGFSHVSRGEVDLVPCGLVIDGKAHIAAAGLPETFEAERPFELESGDIYRRIRQRVIASFTHLPVGQPSAALFTWSADLRGVGSLSDGHRHTPRWDPVVALGQHCPCSHRHPPRPLPPTNPIQSASDRAI